jgi:hypothetical protein
MHLAYSGLSFDTIFPSFPAKSLFDDGKSWIVALAIGHHLFFASSRVMVSPQWELIQKPGEGDNLHQQEKHGRSQKFHGEPPRAVYPLAQVEMVTGFDVALFAS